MNLGFYMEKAGILRIDVDRDGEKWVMIIGSSDVDMYLRKLRSNRKHGRLAPGVLEFARGEVDRLVFSEMGRCPEDLQEAFVQELRANLARQGYRIWEPEAMKSVSTTFMVVDKVHETWVQEGLRAIESGVAVEELRGLIERLQSRGVAVQEVQEKEPEKAEKVRKTPGVQYDMFADNDV